MTVYKPMTPSIRKTIERAYDKQISELNECEDNCYVRFIKEIYKVQRDLLTSLPDGYLLPCEDKGGRE